MKEIKGMPISGQFVAVWRNDGELWSDTYKWVDRILYSLNDDCVFFEKMDMENHPWTEETKFFVTGE